MVGLNNCVNNPMVVSILFLIVATFLGLCQGDTDMSKFEDLYEFLPNLRHSQSHREKPPSKPDLNVEPLSGETKIRNQQKPEINKPTQTSQKSIAQEREKPRKKDPLKPRQSLVQDKDKGNSTNKPSSSNQRLKTQSSNGEDNKPEKLKSKPKMSREEESKIQAHDSSGQNEDQTKQSKVAKPTEDQQKLKTSSIRSRSEEDLKLDDKPSQSKTSKISEESDEEDSKQVKLVLKDGKAHHPVEANASLTLQKTFNRIAEDPKILVDMIKKKFRSDRYLKRKLQNAIKYRRMKNKVVSNSKDEYEDNSNSTAEDDLIMDYAGLPNLFSDSFAELKSEMEKNQNCSEAFQFYYDKAKERLDPKNFPPRLRMTLQGNESATEKWDSFFQRGPDGSHGYKQCYKPNTSNPRAQGKGPCSQAFLGTECPLYPDFALMNYLHPACCDKIGCYCECIYFCAVPQFVMALFEQTIKNYDFLECTREVKSFEEGIKWKETQCEKSKSTSHYETAVKECGKNETKPACVRQGHCFKNICKFCFRWQCVDEELLKSTAEEEQMRKNLNNTKLSESTPKESCSIDKKGQKHCTHHNKNEHKRKKSRNRVYKVLHKDDAKKGKKKIDKPKRKDNQKKENKKG